MKCDKIESLIYLYPELNHHEKLTVDAHIRDCASCKTLYNQLHYQHLLIQKVKELPISAAFPDRIKRNIMRVVERPKRNWIEELFSNSRVYWLRTSMAMTSILLTGFFYTEFSTNSQIPTHTPNTASNIYLNTPKFMQAHIKRRESASQVSFYDCLKQRDCDFLTNLKTNKNL